MSTATNKRASLLAQQKKRDKQKRLIWAGTGVATVIVVIAALVLIAINQSPKASKNGSIAPASLVAAVTTVPAGTFDSIGAGSSQANGLRALDGKALTTSVGLPRVVYIGAEYCPFCAAERWPVTIALSRFGTFSNLGQTYSSGSDVYPSTPTLSFHGATYSSKYLSFEGVEETTNQAAAGGGYTTLDTPTSEQQALLATYDAPPYQPAPGGSIPFLDLGGDFTINGAAYVPSLLARTTPEEVGTAVQDPSSAQAKAILGSANRLTAALCVLTKQQPSNVCTSTGVTAVASQLPKVP